MPTIYDNIEQNLLEGLKQALQVSQRADACVGYLNLRGWKCIADEIDALPANDKDYSACRLIVGMSANADRVVRNYYHSRDTEITQHIAVEHKKRFAEDLARQLTYGVPTAKDESGLRKLAEQLRSGRLTVKFFGAHSLHAKLYLAHRDDSINPIIGFVGSSNLTLSGLEKQGELNIDVLDKDAAEKLAKWFEDQWQNKWCLDITEQLADIIEQSWAGGPVKPYEIYIKTAYELSKEAIEGSREFKVPREFQKIMLEFQKQAVSLAAERLNRHNGVMLGDVVGLGKTLVASAVAKTFQEDRGDSVLVICPPKLEEMWKDYLHRYNIAGSTLSLGQTNKLSDMRRYRLVVIDESHNLRNRDTRRHAHIHDYIRENDSRVILLTATPYNKEFSDIGNQLRLFMEADADLGIRPEDYILSEGGTDNFKRRHPNTLISSLAAFDHSDGVNDWRELMRIFMVRRTRNHIKKNYAEYDEDRKQHYLTFSNGKRYYFPDRVPRCAKFELDEDDARDQYAALYSEGVTDAIGSLKLPRYGVGQYLKEEYSDESLPNDLSDGEKDIIKNLSRAGKRLLGFARSGLFKRLESSGPAFLISVRRHIIRNAVYISAFDSEDGELPIGDIFFSTFGEEIEEDYAELFEEESYEGNELEYFLEQGRRIHENLSSDDSLRNKFQWVDTRLFKEEISDDLREDCRTLLEVLNRISEWDADADRKLDALVRLCKETHKDQKLLIFTQFKDTADYLYKELKKQKIDRIAEVSGSMDGISDYVKRFSPISNGGETNELDELRILITTDTLSEGQNLQDAHIVVNFDLPYAIIRLVQRAGRVDRIGQLASEIFCYCFMPEEGIERIINLRARLLLRIEQNAELIGSDEKFFEGNTVNLEQVYEETVSLEEDDDETDLVSRAYDIWRQAIKNDKEFQRKIELLPNVVYSSKQTNDKDGALAYIKTSNKQHILVQANQAGEIISQSQSKILDLLACSPDEPRMEVAENHHELVAAAVDYVHKGESNIGGQLGGPRTIRHRVYSKLKIYLERHRDSLFESGNRDLDKAIEQILRHPLKDTARDRLGRQLKANISDNDLANMVRTLWGSDDLCALPKANEPVEPHIICSMGLVLKSNKI